MCQSSALKEGRDVGQRTLGQPVGNALLRGAVGESLRLQVVEVRSCWRVPEGRAGTSYCPVGVNRKAFPRCLETAVPRGK